MSIIPRPEDRIPVSPQEISEYIAIRQDNYHREKTKELYANLALPSYVHGYSLAIQYMYDWFEKRFEKDYFQGGIYVDGKHVLDDYKKFSKYIIKGKNPRARMEPKIQFDYDREMLDHYPASPELYIRRSSFEDSFFKDYSNDMFLGMNMRALRMDFNFKVRVNTRAQQLDIFNRMNMYFRIGATQSEFISVDFHVPKSIILNIAQRAGFDIVNDEVVNIIPFINYLNAHSDIPFLFKIRAINQKAEYFIRFNNLYTHIACPDKLSVDDGERDGKLDFNFHVEMNSVLTIPIPHYYVFYSASDLTTNIELKETKDSIAIYSINLFEIPKVDEHGWAQAAITQYAAEDGDTFIDLSPIFTGDNILSKSINHVLTNGISPYHFINIKMYRDGDTAKECRFNMNWNTKVATFEQPEEEGIIHIAVYYDREYINDLDISLNNYHNTRVSK